MYKIKPGVQTSEFWVTMLVNLSASVIAYLVVADVLTIEKANALSGVAAAFIPIIVLLVMNSVTRAYTDGRTTIKMNGNGNGNGGK